MRARSVRQMSRPLFRRNCSEGAVVMRKRLFMVLAGVVAIALSAPVFAQVPDGCTPNALNIPGAPFPCIYPDGRVMFRVSAPDAQKVRVRTGPGFDMTK